MRKSKLKNIKREQVLKAIEIAEEEGMFPSFKYELAYKGNRYSPVDVIKIASKEANGVEFIAHSQGAIRQIMF
ncbi:hypothetical protein [Peribacillus butanolivorans]|uniref:hypothetical protein n=1 Tax=Peribacillus butanolivorans TaxID=421767 RepID=UPI0036D797F7